jgi:hypothetical protein
LMLWVGIGMLFNKAEPFVDIDEINRQFVVFIAVQYNRYYGADAIIVVKYSDIPQYNIFGEVIRFGEQFGFLSPFCWQFRRVTNKSPFPGGNV